MKMIDWLADKFTELRHWWGGNRFVPCVVFHAELQLTEVLLEDTIIVWCPLVLPGMKGHAVDVGYAPDGRLVGVQFWADVTNREALNELRQRTKETV